MARKLTLKQKKFADAYIATKGNGTQAALSTYNTSDYSTAATIANENMKKPEVISYVERKFKASDLTVDKVVKVWNDELESPEAMYRLKASELAGKYLKLFTEKPEQAQDFNPTVFSRGVFD